jgi:hypothetical protein
MVDKVRLKKAQQPRIEQWCKALEITESRFVEDAIAFYLRNLEGKSQGINIIPDFVPVQNIEILQDSIEDIENPEDYDGGLEL